MHMKSSLFQPLSDFLQAAKAGCLVSGLSGGTLSLC